LNSTKLHIKPKDAGAYGRHPCNTIPIPCFNFIIGGQACHPICIFFYLEKRAYT
jgi:hypothetical protein